MAGGTDGQIITYDASGDPVAVGPGTDGQILTSTGAGSPPAFEDAAGGGREGLVFIGTAVASSSATLTVTGLDSTYDSYMIVGSDLDFSTDTRQLFMRFGDSGGIDSGASDYKFASHEHRSDAAHTAVASAGASHIKVSPYTGNVAGEGIGFFAVLTRPGDGTTKPSISGFSSDYDQNSVFTSAQWGGVRDSVIALTQVQIYPETGDFDSGRLTVWGMKHS